MNTFQEINFEPVAREKGDAQWEWYTDGPPYEEIAKALNHYLSNRDKLPHHICPWRPHFQATEWETKTVGLDEIQTDEGPDGDEMKVLTVRLMMHPGVIDPDGKDGLLAEYKFPERGRMICKYSRSREALKHLI